MGSGGKSAGASKSYDYFGTIIAGVCCGPMDVLYSIMVGGKAIWEDTDGLARSGDSVDLSSAIDSKYFTADGQAIFYWGTSSQDISADFGSDHPGYKNVVALGLKNFWFGTEISTAPNIEIVGARLPVCDTSLCDSGDNVFYNRQVNTVAALAELITSPFGLNLDLARLDAAAWLTASSWCYDNRPLRFCSPLITESADARGEIMKLLNLIQARLAWTAAGLLTIKLLEPGVDPGGLDTLDARHFTAKPRLSVAGWGQVPTAVIVNYFDGDRKFKAADVKLDNLAALKIRGETQRQIIEAPHIVRRGQAEALAAEAIRQQQHPPATIEVSVRREHAMDLRPGDKVLVDVDPEPGGSGLAHLAVVADRRDGNSGEIVLKLNLDPIADSTLYTPTWVAPSPQEGEVASIENALVIPMPTISGPSIAILAARPQDDCNGFEVFFATYNAGDFVDLGKQEGFAVRMTVDATVATPGSDLVVGKNYTIADNSGGADFMGVGAPSNIVGTDFLCVGFVFDGDPHEIIVGATYKIWFNGTADFTGIGAPNNNIGTTFVATGTSPTWGNGVLSTTDPLSGILTTTPTWGTGKLTSDETVGDLDTVFRMTLTDGASGRDAYLAERTAGDEITAKTDQLLAVLANMDVDGKVIITDGVPECEMVSIVSRSAVDSDTHDYVVLRGRKNFNPRIWDISTVQVWIIPGIDLVEWSHPDMLPLATSEDVAYIRLAATTAYTQDTTNPLPEFQFQIPLSYEFGPKIEWTDPADVAFELPTNGELSPEATITDADGNLVRAVLFSKNEQTGILTTWFDLTFRPAESALLSDLFALANVATPIDFGTQTSDDQYFTLTLRVYDAAGNTEESSRTLMLPGSSAPNLGSVNYSPPGSHTRGHDLNVTLTVASPATNIHLRVQKGAAVTSDPPTTWVTNPDTVTFKVNAYYPGYVWRVWARATDRTDVSAWQFEDYIY